MDKFNSRLQTAGEYEAWKKDQKKLSEMQHEEAKGCETRVSGDKADTGRRTNN